MTRLYLIKTPGGDLIGYDSDDQDYVAKLKPGDSLECDTQKARNPGHHKKFFALFNAAFEGQSRYASKHALMIELKVRAGWYDEHITSDGKMVFVPKSLSWSRMGQEEFEKFYNEAVVALAEMFGTEDVVIEADEIIARTGT